MKKYEYDQKIRYGDGVWTHNLQECTRTRTYLLAMVQLVSIRYKKNNGN